MPGRSKKFSATLLLIRLPLFPPFLLHLELHLFCPRGGAIVSLIVPVYVWTQHPASHSKRIHTRHCARWLLSVSHLGMGLSVRKTWWKTGRLLALTLWGCRGIKKNWNGTSIEAQICERQEWTQQQETLQAAEMHASPWACGNTNSAAKRVWVCQCVGFYLVPRVSCLGR